MLRNDAGVYPGIKENFKFITNAKKTRQLPGFPVLRYFLRYKIPLLLQQVFQGYTVHIFVDRLVKSLPERKSHAFRLTRTGIDLLLQTSHRRQLSLGIPQDLSHRIVLRQLRQTIAALRSPDALKQAQLPELGHDLLQVF